MQNNIVGGAMSLANIQAREDVAVNNSGQCFVFPAMSLGGGYVCGEDVAVN